MHASALPSLPLTELTAHWPSYRLEVVDLATGKILYRRPYARPGYVEAYGPDCAWTRLPERHTQVLVTLIPAFREHKKLHVRAYEPNNTNPWLSIPLR